MRRRARAIAFASGRRCAGRLRSSGPGCPCAHSGAAVAQGLDAGSVPPLGPPTEVMMAVPEAALKRPGGVLPCWAPVQNLPAMSRKPQPRHHRPCRPSTSSRPNKHRLAGSRPPPELSNTRRADNDRAAHLVAAHWSHRNRTGRRISRERRVSHHRETSGQAVTAYWDRGQRSATPGQQVAR